MAFMSMILVWMILCLVFYVPGYVLTGVGLYTLAKRRGIERAWTAWVPLMNVWLIGCISDQYQALVRGKQKNKRTVLFFLVFGLLILFCALQLFLFFPTVNDNTLLFLLLFVPAWCMMAVLVVITFMALYDLYVSCDPANAVLFLIFSILLPVTQPFFLFFCRKKDLGFPL